MKILLLSILFFVISPSKILAQAINAQDSLSLINFYNSTNGDNWKDHTNWKTDQPVKTWYGISVTGDRVTGIQMWGNNISGNMPASFGNLTALTYLTLIDNKISGSIPSSFGNLINLRSVDLGANPFTGTIPETLGNLIHLKELSLYSNYLTGSLPVSLAKLDSLAYLDVQYSGLSGDIPLEFMKDSFGLYIQNNQFTFKDIEPFAKVSNIFKVNRPNYIFQYDQQSNIKITQQGAKLYVSPGGTLANDTLRWYNQGLGELGLTATIIGDTTFTPDSAINYYVTITNSIATELTLKSDPFTVHSIIPNTTTTIKKNTTGLGFVNFDDGITNLLQLMPTQGVDGLTGDVSSTVTIDPSVSTYKGQPYVQRHYDIVPAMNSSNAKATVILFFTQQEFDNYNAYVTSNNLNIPLLPINGINNGNVRISQFHGTFTGSSNPANYDANNAVLINPNVVWDSYNNWWMVTFPVSGFSGFFLNTYNSVLPLTLLNFNGKTIRNTISLQWQTSAEINTKEFIIQRNNANEFHNIDNIPAQSLAVINNYNYSDKYPLQGNNFYRLKMIDKDGKFTYSNIILINFDGIASHLKIFPNPVSSVLTVKIISNKKENIILNITDASGKSVSQITTSVNGGTTSTSINIKELPAGVYYLNTQLNDKSERISFVKSK